MLACFLSSTAVVHRKLLPVASQACGSELIMHNIMQPLTSVEFVGTLRIFSSEGEWCRGMLLQRTGVPAELHLDVWGRMVKSLCSFDRNLASVHLLFKMCSNVVCWAFFFF